MMTSPPEPAALPLPATKLISPPLLDAPEPLAIAISPPDGPEPDMMDTAPPTASEILVLSPARMFTVLPTEASERPVCRVMLPATAPSELPVDTVALPLWAAKRTSPWLDEISTLVAPDIFNSPPLGPEPVDTLTVPAKEPEPAAISTEPPCSSPAPAIMLTSPADFGDAPVDT